MEAHLIERRGRHTVITVSGQLDLATSPEELLAQLPGLGAAADGFVVLDLSGVSFLDCGGLRALFALERQLSHDGRDLCVAAASPAVARVFELLSAYLAVRGTFKPCPGTGPW
jgi:anti-sigma B factor antagonist